MSQNAVAQVEPARVVALYEQAERSLAEAVTLLDVMSVRNVAEMLKAQAKLIRDPEAQAQAYLLRTKAERKLGEVLLEAKARGELSRGGRPVKGQENGEGVSLGKAALADAGITWKLSSQAQKLAGFDARQFAAVLEAGAAKIRSGKAVVINPVRDLTTQDKQLRRKIREMQLAARQRALPQARYGLILADPEWPFEVWSEAGKDRSAENHYPTSSLEVIATRPVMDIAHADAVLLLWVTGPHLAAGSHVPVMRGWGFTPRAIVTWDKMVAGTGYWFLDRTEFLVVGVRGNVPAPAPGTQWESLVAQLKAAHSEKPDFAYELAEAYFPSLSKIELNARRARKGWAAWGLEAPDQDDDEPGSRPLGTTVQNLSAEAGTTSLAGAEGEADRHSNSPEGGMHGSAQAGRIGPQVTADLTPSGEPRRPDEPADPAGGATHGASGRRESSSPALTERSEVGSLGQPLGGPVAAKPEDLPGAREAAPGEGGEGRGQARLLPETIPGEEPGNETGETVLSEGDQEGSGAARPGLDLTDAEKNAIIAEAYAAAVFPGIAWLEERTGLKGPAIKKRASRAGLGSRERQRASASAFATQQNNDRAVGRSGRSADRTERDDQRAVGRSGRSADRTEQTDERAGA